MMNNSPMQLFSFDCLAKRVLYRYVFTFTEFIPIESESVPVDSQRAFYDICAAMVRDIADDPSLLGLSTEHPDEWLGAHDTMNRHPALYKVRNACQKTFGDLFNFLYAIGLHGQYDGEHLEINRSDIPKLTAKAFTQYTDFIKRYSLLAKKDGDSFLFTAPELPQLLSAWQLLALKCSEFPPREQASRFSLWLHSGDHIYFLKRIEKLLGLDESLFRYIDKEYAAKGYRVYFGTDEYRATCTYLKDVGGLSIEFATLFPTVRFVNATSIGIKTALEHIDELDEDIKGWLIRFCRPCSDCMGCTKGGANRQFTIIVHYNGCEHHLCPEFVQMEWFNSDISTEKIDFMLKLNELQERFGRNWRSKR